MTDQKHQPTAIPVAVVAVTAIYPGEPGLEGYWRTITGGRDAIGDVPPSHWLIDDYYDPDPTAVDKTYCKRGGFIEPVHFDPMQFGLPPNALPATDSAQLLALIAAKEVLDKAMSGRAVDLDRVDIVLGVASTTELVVQMGSRMQQPVWRKAMLENGLPEDEADEICRDIADHYVPWLESTFPGLLGNVVAGRVANRLNLGGSNFVVDAACASSLSAVQVALHKLYLHESDLVLTGGVDALNDVMMYMCFSKTPAFSRTGDCRPFSDGADGTIIGEGVGMMALKRLSDAERDGDEIHAVIRGLGSSSDGRASSVYAPRSEGQAKALRRAYDRAGYEPSTVGLLEAHGTATKAGDVAEFAALKSVFTDTGSRVALGSVKSQIGHTKAAAGAAGLIKAILALQHSTLPGTLKVERPNPALGLDETPFYINADTRPWVRSADLPRRASVSSFGFGGSNFHVTLEEYQGRHRAKRLRTLPTELVVLSATDEAELQKRAADLITAVRAGEGLARIAFECAHEFDATQPARAGLVAADTVSLEALAEKLQTALADGAVSTLKDPDIAVGFGTARQGKTAFLFPGQGSQYVGMGGDLALEFPAALAVWDGLGGDLAGLSDVVFPEPAFDSATADAQRAELTAMDNAQPAIAATSLSQLALLEILGVTADAAAGHSFGEVTALAAAGVIPTDRLVETARTRGVLMAEAGHGKDGAMLAVVAGVDDVRSLLESQPESAGSLVIANDNAPKQVVLAGHASDIEWAEAAVRSAGWVSRRLPVASAFHSPIVAASSAPLTDYLKSLELGSAAFPVYANATAQPYDEQVADQLGDQVRQPVKFREMIEAMADADVTRFIEVGPSRVLTGLVGQILAGTPHLAVALDDSKSGGLRGWHRGLAALAADGVVLDLVALFDHYAEPAKHVPAPAHAVLVGGANLGKPYPPADGKTSITPKRVRVTSPEITTPQENPLATVEGRPPMTQVVQRMEPPRSQPAAVATPAAAVPAPAAHAPAPEVHVPAASSAPLSADAWSVIDHIQRETAQQHQRYLDVMTQSHQAFLDVAAQMMAEIVHDQPSAPQTPRVTLKEVVQTPASVQNAVVATPSVAAVLSPVQPVQPVPVAVPAETASPNTSGAPAAGLPVGAVVLGIVSEKTGYPADMLSLEMEMEAELGIDSIKQVEILAALQAKFPGAPEIPASELAGLRTLQDVVDTVGGFASGGNAAPVVAAPVVAPAAGLPVGAVVLGIVSEKTGYPADMLSLEMEMEAELGIDSIKQVEILAALQAKFPGAPEIPASELAGLRTLQDVVDTVGGFAAGEEEPAPTADDAPDDATPSGGLSCTEANFQPVPPSGFAMAGLRDGEVFITREDPAFADALEQVMVDRGIKARAVDELPDRATAVVSLAALGPADTAGDCVDMHVRAFRAARSVARSDSASRLFVTVQSTGGTFTATDTPTGVASLAKTAAWEWPDASVRAIDIERLDAERVTAELLEGGSGIEVALRADGTRLVAVDDIASSVGDGETVSVPAGGVVVVTGGARGVTAASALALAKRHGLRLALLGRTPLRDATADRPAGATVAEIATALAASARTRGAQLSLPEARVQAEKLMAEREVRATLATAEQQGTTARYFSASITDGAALRGVLDEVRTALGPIVGVVHGAGVLADKRLEDLGDAQFVTVFSTKLVGAETLLDATSSDDLRFISMFSSIAARAGNPGQSAYAAANAALESIAAREAARRGDGCVVRAFGWGPWDGGMVDATLKSRFLDAGVGVIPIDEGAQFFAEHALRRSPATSVVVAAPAEPRLRAAHLEWDVSVETLPVLEDHQVRGQIVVPVVIVLDAMLRAARDLTGDASVVVRDFQVLSGVTFGVCGQQDLAIDLDPAGSSYTATVHDCEGRPRYRAILELASTPPTSVGVPQVSGSAWPTSVEDAYAGPLFHGPRFAVIDRLDSFGSAGGTATLKTLADLGWSDVDWAIDPASVDGGLQLGILWASAHGYPLVLPVRIGRAALHRSFGDAGALRCRLAAHPVNDKRVDFDITFETTDGAPVATLEGVEFYVAGTGS
ncbi:SDR family NAD(P)-dependent oxidoreductase [Mycolicibacterium sp. S2-37]|uniref:type I polyketide synthase n=1 Tax=Mycolicibacterium sp. S2-37 TaxID=2810297 RepID=UPI001A94C79A|nr:type I polyketide synthase [Mycolicibacterium sp. S2-37]MBO0675902.1 SDR family NAD(P)-dependent oxidoreductase [Mycolicibacterium sp. S2-37]